jgi:hypothetical protein
MKTLTFLPTLVLAALTAIFPAQGVELVKAETIDSKALTIQAKQMLTIEVQQMHVKVDATESLTVVKNNLDKQAKVAEKLKAKEAVYAVNFAE